MASRSPPGQEIQQYLAARASAYSEGETAIRSKVIIACASELVKPKDWPLDVIVLANGSDNSTCLHRVTFRNGEGRPLHAVWRSQGGRGACTSIAVHGVPSFFMAMGPNAAGGHSPATLAREDIAGHVLLNFVAEVPSRRARTVDVKVVAEHRYTADVQRWLKDKVWQGCRGGHMVDLGWNSSVCT